MSLPIALFLSLINLLIIGFIFARIVSPGTSASRRGVTRQNLQFEQKGHYLVATFDLVKRGKPYPQERWTKNPTVIWRKPDGAWDLQESAWLEERFLAYQYYQDTQSK